MSTIRKAMPALLGLVSFIGPANAQPITLECGDTATTKVSVVFDEQAQTLQVSGNEYAVTRLDKQKIEGEQIVAHWLKGEQIASTGWIKIDRVTGGFVGGFRLTLADGRSLEQVQNAPPTAGYVAGNCAIAAQKF
jgi:hypothetical protein